MSQVNTTANTFVSPYVSTYAPGAYINIDSSLNEIVTVTGIHNKFTVNLTDPTKVADFLGGFTVSNVTVDTRLQQLDMDMSGMSVDMSGNAFKSVLQEDIIKVATDGNGDAVGTYLHDQLYNAFVTAFGDMLPNSTIAPANSNAAGGGGGSAGAPAQQLSGDTAEASTNNNGTVTAQVGTIINSFDVLVDMDASAAAQAMIDQHATNASALASLFRQIPRTTWQQYLDMSSNGTYIEGEAQDLSTNSLPLLKGDKLVFVFDIDVTAAGPNTEGNTGTAAGGQEIPASTTYEDVPTAGPNQSTGLGVSYVSLNLANRRVAFEITLSPSDKDTGDLISP